MSLRIRLNKLEILLSKNLLESKQVRKKRQDMKSIESFSAGCLWFHSCFNDAGACVVYRMVIHFLFPCVCRYINQ